MSALRWLSIQADTFFCFLEVACSTRLTHKSWLQKRSSKSTQPHFSFHGFVARSRLASLARKHSSTINWALFRSHAFKARTRGAPTLRRGKLYATIRSVEHLCVLSCFHTAYNKIGVDFFGSCELPAARASWPACSNGNRLLLRLAEGGVDPELVDVKQPAL